MPLKQEVVAPGRDDRQQGHHSLSLSLSLCCLLQVGSGLWGEGDSQQLSSSVAEGERAEEGNSFGLFVCCGEEEGHGVQKKKKKKTTVASRIH